MRIFLSLLLLPTLSAQPAVSLAPSPAKPLTDQKAVVRDQEIAIKGKVLKYKSTTGMMPLKTEVGEVEAQLFYVAYTVEGPNRPLTICFNGGPGAGSLWLHLGAIGPQRAMMNDDGSLPPAPYKMSPNESTWLEKSDLVFVDPVGTGFSRARTAEVGRKYFGLRGDIESVGTFVRHYLNQTKRWQSPLYIAGESYGTTRAAGLSQWLVDHGIALNGVMLISTIMNFQTVRFERGNDVAYATHLPTYTAIAWYHKKLPADLQKDLRKAVEESRKFASGDYQHLLYKGDTLTPEERKRGLDQLVRLTGLSRDFLDHSELRVEIQRFTKELLRDRGLTVGRLDGRLTGHEGSATAETPTFDPSLTAIRPPYTAIMNQYAREQLGWEDEKEYFALGGGITAPWDWGITQNGGQGFADTSENLRAALERNPHMRVFIATGYYDLATPFHAVEYTVSHMGLTPALRKNLQWSEYEAGHMMYIHVPSLKKLKADVDAYYDESRR